jgi:hypothetical protein
MIRVDTSVWIDYFNGQRTWQTNLYDDRDFDPMVSHLSLKVLSPE